MPSKPATVMVKNAQDNTMETFRTGRISPVGYAETPGLRWLKFEDGSVRVAVKLEDHVNLAQAAPPDVVDYSVKAMNAIKRIYLNNKYGDCVIAGKAHQIGIWTGNATGQAVEVNDQDVLSAYHRICGPGDNGCVITDVLDTFKSQGLWGHKIDGYVAVDNKNKLLVQTAIDLFGSLTLGINLPRNWTCTNCTWDENTSGNVGGHDICCVGYNAQGVQACTWGGIVTITWPAFNNKPWITECYAELAPDWYSQGNLAPNGVDVAGLQAALAAIAGGQTPPIPEQFLDWTTF